MKVIDLLNKMANNEEMPLKIKIRGDIYRQSNGQFWCDETELYMIDCTSVYHLNDEVEILEEPKGIPEKIQKDDFEDINEEEPKLWIAIRKINEIIDCLEYLESKGE